MDYQEIVLIDGAYLTSLLADIEKAQTSIDFEVYIFEEQSVGKRVADALARAARRGVKVRVLVDGVGSRDWDGEVVEQLETAGVKTKIFHPLPWAISHWDYSTEAHPTWLSKLIFLLSKINSRNHRKVCIIDKRIVYVGSANITEHLIDRGIEKAWRETTIKLVNVEINDIQFAFEKAWGGLRVRDRIYNTLQRKDAQPIFRLNYFWRGRRIFYKSLLTRISRCEKRVWVTNSYFFPSPFLLKQLIRASRRGVDVRILLPAESDVFISSLASMTFYNILLKNKVLIYEYLPTMLHAKVLILDDWYSVGSNNLNNRSLRHDLEVEVNVRSEEAKEILECRFLADITSARQLSLSELKKQPFYKSWFGYATLMIGYWI